jgi:hypothetical protein
VAEGPDPNRHPETDPELSGEEQREGAGLGNPDSTRMSLSSGAIALLTLVIAGVILLLLW